MRPLHLKDTYTYIATDKVMAHRLHTVILLGLLATLLLIAMVIYAIVHEPAKMSESSRKVAARSIETGAGLYDLHCRTCHGIKGEGIGQLGPALNDRPFFTERLKEVGWQDTLESYIISSSAHGRLIGTRPKYAGNESTAVMTPWLEDYGGPLRRDQIKNIAAFVMNWQPTALGKVELINLELPGVSLDDPNTINLGKRLFTESCGDCHLISDVSVPSRKAPVLDSIAARASSRQPEKSPEEYIRDSVLMPAEYIVEGFDPEILGYSCGSVLSATQLDAITAYLLTRR